jgi:hypothetical protein
MASVAGKSAIAATIAAGKSAVLAAIAVASAIPGRTIGAAASGCGGSTAAAFSPAPQAFGTSGVGVVRGPGSINFDFNLSKSFALDESRSLQFRTEVFNAFNHANFNPPDIRRDATTFGQILSAQNGRIVQFGMKLNF